MIRAILVEPKCIGNHANVESAAAYLEPNRNTLQKPKRGRSLLEFSLVISTLGIPKRGRSVMAFSATIGMLKRRYLRLTL